MTRRSNGTLTAAPEPAGIPSTTERMVSGGAGSRQPSSRRPPPRCMAFVRVPEFPGWLLLLLVSISSGARYMFVCLLLLFGWPLRPGPLIRPGPFPEARRSACLVASQARIPLTQDKRQGGRPDPCGKWSNGTTTRHGDIETWISSSSRAARGGGGVVAHVPKAPARRDISDRHVKSVDWMSRWQKAGCR